MATITEDYCSKELSLLLDKKGFDGYSTPYSKLILGGFIPHSVAMKWLREVHNVFISVSIGNHKKDNRDIIMPDFVYYFFYITDTKAVYEEEKQCHKEFSTFEEACEAALKYVLENLI